MDTFGGQRVVNFLESVVELDVKQMAMDILKEEIAIELLLKEGCPSRTVAIEFIDGYKECAVHNGEFNPLDLSIIWKILQTANREPRQ